MGGRSLGGTLKSLLPRPFTDLVPPLCTSFAGRRRAYCALRVWGAEEALV